MRKRVDLLLLLPFAAVLGWLQSLYSGYIKDDTFIALRYARNVAEGHGMVFNYGQRLEGYTDFLWVIMSVPAFWLGVDPVTWVKGLACLFGMLGLVVTYELARHLAGDRLTHYALVGVGVWAVSGSVCLWSMAGMEPTAMAVFCSGGVLFLMKLWDRKDDGGDTHKLVIAASVLLLAGALCRPEGHLFLLVAAAVGLADAARRGYVPKPWVRMAVLFTLVMGPYHLWRYLYFGGLVPNTYLAKSGSLDVDSGAGFAGELIAFQANPGVFALGLIAMMVGWRERKVLAAVCITFLAARFALVEDWSLLVWLDLPVATVAVFGLAFPKSQDDDRWFARGLAFVLAWVFVAYLVKVGRDEMKWFRLYLPVYPLALALASDGARRIGEGIEALVEAVTPEPMGRPLVPVLVVIMLLVPAWKISMELNQGKAERHSRYLKWSEESFQEMGRYVRERSEAGDVIVFQDMGAAPFAAGDLRWVDTIGILDKRVATELKAEGVNPFLRGRKRNEPGGREALRAMDERLRDYFLEQDPEWIAFVAYVAPKKRRKFKRNWRRLDEDDLEGQEKMLRPYLSRGHSHNLARDDRFNDGFHYVMAWPRLFHGYWVVLYEANDR
ncbi:MAG: hypothetical protein GY898_02570 [Proteobacteria bacterium]|nr:hypothetical protein [Pseudomonadota bacterium]